MNCGDTEENPGVLDQCYNNNNFVTTAVLGLGENDMCKRPDACFRPVCMQSLV